MAFSSAITAAAFSRDAFLLSWAWIALSIFAIFLTLDLGTTENMFRYPTLLTVSQVQTILHISRTTAYKMIQSNEIKSLRIGRSIRIPKDCIVDYIRTSCYNDGRNELLPSEKEVYKECELMRPRKKDSSMRSATAAPDIPNRFMSVFLPMKPQICASHRLNMRSPLVNFIRRSRCPYKPNARRRSSSPSASYWTNMCRSTV